RTPPHGRHEGIAPDSLYLKQRQMKSLSVEPIWFEGIDAGALRPADDLPRHAEVVVLGGGIVGMAVAYFLAARGVTAVLVLGRRRDGWSRRCRRRCAARSGSRARRSFTRSGWGWS